MMCPGATQEPPVRSIDRAYDVPERAPPRGIDSAVRERAPLAQACCKPDPRHVARALELTRPVLVSPAARPAAAVTVVCLHEGQSAAAAGEAPGSRPAQPQRGIKKRPRCLEMESIDGRNILPTRDRGAKQRAVGRYAEKTREFASRSALPPAGARNAKHAGRARSASTCAPPA